MNRASRSRRALRALALWPETALRAAPGHTALLAVCVTVQAVAAPAQSFGLARLLDGVTAHDRPRISVGAAVIVAALLGVAVVNAFSLLLESGLYDRLHGHVHRELLRVNSLVPGIEHHEDPAVADRLSQVRDDVEDMAHSALYLMAPIATAVSTVTSLGLLASVHPLLLLVPLFGLARMWAATRAARLRQRSVEEGAARGRVHRELVRTAADPAHGIELRVFALRPFLLRRMERLAAELNGMQRTAFRRGGRAEALTVLAFGLLYAASVVFAVALAREGRITLGQVALVVTLTPAVQGIVASLANSMSTAGNMARVFGRYRWLRDYAEDAARRAPTGPAPTRLAEGIALRGVGFRYPSADRPALSGIDLDLPAGATVALVGENGAGKSTLVKLLAKLYSPTSGTITADGADLAAVAPDAWRARLSAGFQDFTRFEFTAGETIGVGDLPRLGDEPALRGAAARADAGPLLERLPDGLAQRLGKRFKDGADLSGGQWQRLALARAFLREGPLLLLLDEPTAALDPEAEHALFARFADASRAAARRTGGITLLVSHRFSTVRTADLIVVMEGGRITERGSHEELVAAGGRYAELFELQARAYR
ncbi:hypothetical protein BIV57_13020 [Mangrovactinospora gilvigrisea]|uniref:ABC transporter ATP-binding protein n=1 Tax=Mangrovactinospora gilvigrisea TaxID=1428644 RepID=A0A1J7C695_9ACTN|nr:ABC transporter ATP-binding protein [Mangrovactinospora gilvigrisea]OIV37080.1 hypothetical protein BIV57_13020 [Mangrovactinospora gilvigrisea]